MIYCMKQCNTVVFDDTKKFVTYDMTSYPDLILYQ